MNKPVAAYESLLVLAQIIASAVYRLFASIGVKKYRKVDNQNKKYKFMRVPNDSCVYPPIRLIDLLQCPTKAR